MQIFERGLSVTSQATNEHMIKMHHCTCFLPHRINEELAELFDVHLHSRIRIHNESIKVIWCNTNLGRGQETQIHYNELRSYLEPLRRAWGGIGCSSLTLGTLGILEGL